MFDVVKRLNSYVDRPLYMKNKKGNLCTQNVKAVVLDLDGTLLDSQKEVSGRNERVIIGAQMKMVLRTY